MSAKIDPNLIKIVVHASLSNGYLNLLSKINFEKVDKSASFEPWFDQPWTMAKIAPHLIEIGVYAYLSNGYLNQLSNFDLRKSTKVHIFNLGLTNLEWGPKHSKYHKNRCPCLSLKWVLKSTFKTQFQESREKWIFSTLVWPTLNNS